MDPPSPPQRDRLQNALDNHPNNEDRQYLKSIISDLHTAMKDQVILNQRQQASQNTLQQDFDDVTQLK